MITIDEEKEIYYDEAKQFNLQSENFKIYFNELYNNKVTDQVKSIGYPDFNEDGSITFLFEDDFVKYDVTRIQVKPKSTSYRAVKETLVEIVVK